MDCLTNIIKLSRTQCQCFDEGKPTDYNEGQTEVYLDELSGLSDSLILSANDCSNGSMWDMMARSRENATLKFKADLLAGLNMEYQPAKPNYSGLLGQQAINMPLQLTENTAGTLVNFPNVRAGYMTVTRIGVAFNISQPITIQVFDNDEHQVTPIAQYTINSVANTIQFGDLDDPLKLPLWSRNRSDLKYYFVYARAGVLQPMNNKADCGCAGGSVSLWKNWVSVQGIRGNVPTPLSGFNTSMELNGLLLDASFTCETSMAICNDEQPLDFNNDGVAMYMAYAIRYKAGSMLVSEILSSGKINRYTMRDREYMLGRISHFNKQYDEHLQYVCQSVSPNHKVDCLRCRPSGLISKGPILT